MTPTTVLVIDKPGAPHLRAVEALPAPAQVIVSYELRSALDAASKAEVILNGLPDGELLRKVFVHAHRLRWVHSLSAGVEKILSPELCESPVRLTNSRGVFSRALAEFVVAAIFFFVRDIGRIVRSQQAGIWDPFDMDFVKGKVMGIVGYGATGRACGEMARALGMKVLGLRRRPELSQGDPWLAQVMGPDRLRDLVSQSDYVVLAVPDTPRTRKLMGEAELAAMKSTTVLINIGRGSLIDEGALIRALELGQIGGAALDVFEIEPLPPDHPFYRLKNLLLSPHSADHTHGYWELAVAVFLRNFERFLRDEPLENVVDKTEGY